MCIILIHCLCKVSQIPDSTTSWLEPTALRSAMIDPSRVKVVLIWSSQASKNSTHKGVFSNTRHSTFIPPFMGPKMEMLAVARKRGRVCPPCKNSELYTEKSGAKTAHRKNDWGKIAIDQTWHFHTHKFIQEQQTEIYDVRHICKQNENSFKKLSNLVHMKFDLFSHQISQVYICMKMSRLVHHRKWSPFEKWGNGSSLERGVILVAARGPSYGLDNGFMSAPQYFSVYNLCQKKRTFNSEFFRGPPWGEGGKKFTWSIM